MTDSHITAPEGILLYHESLSEAEIALLDRQNFQWLKERGYIEADV